MLNPHAAACPRLLPPTGRAFRTFLIGAGMAERAVVVPYPCAWSPPV